MSPSSTAWRTQAIAKPSVSSDLQASVRDYIRAAGGGLIVGLPLLYTMEVWFAGFILPWWKLLLLLAVAYAVVLGYNSVSGFRRERTVRELLVDSVSTMGLGIAIAFVALVLLGRIDGDSSVRDAAGKVALEAIPVAFGASIAAAQLSGQTTGQATVSPMARMMVGAGGALLFALNVAPTEEPVMLGIHASPWLLLAVVAASLAITFALVFLADFGGRPHMRGKGVLDHPWSETLTSYAISIGVALLLLWSFGRTEGASYGAIVGMTVMLAFVGSVGAAVARILVGGEHEGGAK
jgi:putative integral membrane protein (TIGR02587 family)